MARLHLDKKERDTYKSATRDLACHIGVLPTMFQLETLKAGCWNYF